jgi:hypothetical protein
MTIVQRGLTAREIADALGAKRTGKNRWRTHCPAHADKNPSFDIADKDGKPLFKCWSGCTQDDVLAALVERGLWHAKGQGSISRRPTMTPEQVEAAKIFIAVYRDNIRSGALFPSLTDIERYVRYRKALDAMGVSYV